MLSSLPAIDPEPVQDRSDEINALKDSQPTREPDPAPEIQEASQRAMNELYRWFDTDDRFTRRLDAISAYIAALEARSAAKTRAKKR